MAILHCIRIYWTPEQLSGVWTNAKVRQALVLYICGQALNLLLSFLMAWLVFTYLFPQVTNELLSK